MDRGGGIPVSIVAVSTLVLLLVPAAGLADESVPESGPRRIQSERETDRFLRGELHRGRALQAEGKLDAAVRAFRYALSARPEDAALNRALALALEAEGEADEAREYRQRADAADPPPPAPPGGAWIADAAHLLAVLVAPPAEADAALRANWSTSAAEAALRSRIATRLPGATITRADPETVSAARQWLSGEGARAVLSLRTDRIYCGFTVKDGRIGAGELRAAAATPGSGALTTTSLRVAIDDPRLPGGCEAEVVARGLEMTLADPALATALRSSEASIEWGAPAVRALFPDLTRRIGAELLAGRRMLNAGRIERAQAAFERAARIDPDDPRVQDHLAETQLVLALARELDAKSGAPVSETGVDPRFDRAARDAAERALGEEQQRRDELLATLAVLDEDVRLPPREALDALRPIAVIDAQSFGPQLARKRVGGTAIEARVAYAPDGSVVAIYYFAIGSHEPVVREEDTRRDGQADRWITYRDGARHEIYEGGRGDGRPDIRFVFAEGGEPLERVEIGARAGGGPARVFVYTGGDLVAEERDTDGDGRLDRFDRFDGEGQLGMREEDLDGDGEIDVRSIYRSGKLVRRELSDPELPES